jgi:hypothetical protein
MAAEMEILRGQDLAPYLKRLSQLRMAHYKGYPYLYEGSDDHEREYISDFPNNQHSILVGAFEDGELEGFVLGTPLEGDSPILASIPDKIYRRANTYVETRALWERFGYVKQPAKLTYEWASLDVAGNVTMQTHEMNLWSKTIT